MQKITDETVLISGVSATFILLLLTKQLEFISLWGSLLILVSTAMYYSYTFFKAVNPYEKFFYFLGLIPLIISYFALVYKVFGIVDSTTNQEIEPDWLNAMYFSVVTWTTLGYGDFKPINALKVWVMAEALMGYVFMGLLVSKVLFLSQRSNRDAE